MCIACGKRIVNDVASTHTYTHDLQINTSDFSSNHWVTCFQDTGAEILGCSAQELGELRDQKSPDYDSVFQKANFKDFIFQIRAKMDTFNVSRKRIMFLC